MGNDDKIVGGKLCLIKPLKNTAYPLTLTSDNIKLIKTLSLWILA
jgi:hypothetical protein